MTDEPSQSSVAACVPSPTSRWRWTYFVSAILYMTLIFMLSSRSGGPGQPGTSWLLRLVNIVPGFSDKGVHACEFGVLGALWMNAIRRPFWAWTIAAVYGITDEIHQSFVPGREADPRDWVADLIGSGIGVYLTFWWSRRAAARNRE